MSRLPSVGDEAPAHVCVRERRTKSFSALAPDPPLGSVAPIAPVDLQTMRFYGGTQRNRERIECVRGSRWSVSGQQPYGSTGGRIYNSFSDSEAPPIAFAGYLCEMRHRSLPRLLRPNWDKLCSKWQTTRLPRLCQAPSHSVRASDRWPTTTRRWPA